jgi:hypothetical protein
MASSGVGWLSNPDKMPSVINAGTNTRSKAARRQFVRRTKPSR